MNISEKVAVIMEQPMRPVEVFYSYAHEDESLQKELDKHLINLKRQGFITTRHSHEAKAGSEWKREIAHHLNSADIILLLLSPDFMASEFCYSFEMEKALRRHFLGEARVIPIILRPVNWQETLLNSLQVLPYDGKPMTLRPDRDEAFREIAMDIRVVITAMQKAHEENDARWAEYRRRGTPSTAPPLMGDFIVDRAIAEVHIDRAGVYSAHQNYEEALTIYEQALRLCPNEVAALIGKGDVLQKLQRYQESLVTYEQALHVNPRSAVAYRGKGDVLYKLLRWREALDAYEQAYLLDPNDSAAYRGKCDTLQELQRDKVAFDAYEQAQRQAREKELAERQAHEEELARWRLLPPAICSLGHTNPAESAFCDDCGEPLRWKSAQ